MRKRRKIRFEESSGNVFADIGVPNPEEALLKAQLTFRINQIIERRRLTQAQAAKLLRVDQPKVSALQRGRLTDFSVERLMRFLVMLGQDVEIMVKPRPRSRSTGQLRVA